MLLATGSIIAGLVILVWAADRFVMGAAALARNLGVAPLLIGLTVVGFGTSAPEILVAVMASANGNPAIAIGNAVGSNIANIGLILGITALVTPLLFKSSVLRREYPVMLGVSALALILLSNGTLDMLDGLLLLGSLAGILALMAWIALQRPAGDPMTDEYAAEIRTDLSTPAAIAWFTVGLVLLLISSRMLVWGAVEVATAFGVSDLVIGLTIIAIGTSLPELAASVASALKNEPDIAVGNVIGSNIYNILAVLSVPGLVAPSQVDEQVLTRDLPVMLGLTLLLFLMGRGRDGDGHINRAEGFILLACFIGYQFWLYSSARGI